jgi:hypothetical protein
MRGNSLVNKTLSPRVRSVEKYRQMRFTIVTSVPIDAGKFIDRSEAKQRAHTQRCSCIGVASESDVMVALDFRYNSRLSWMLPLAISRSKSARRSTSKKSLSVWLCRSARKQLLQDDCATHDFEVGIEVQHAGVAEPTSTEELRDRIDKTQWAPEYPHLIGEKP